MMTEVYNYIIMQTLKNEYPNLSLCCHVTINACFSLRKLFPLDVLPLSLVSIGLSWHQR